MSDLVDGLIALLGLLMFLLFALLIVSMPFWGVALLILVLS